MTIKISIDPSITSSGVAVETDKHTYLFAIGEKITIRDNGVMLDNHSMTMEFIRIKKTNVNSIERYMNCANIICDAIEKVIGEDRDVASIIEGGSYGSKGMLHSIGEFSGVLQTVMYYRLGLMSSVCSPSQWKKGNWGKGKGSAKKDFIWAQFGNMYPVSGLVWKETSPLQDCADAYFILEYMKKLLV